MAWSLGQRRDGERGGERGDGDGLDVLEPEGVGVGEDEADGSGRERTHATRPSESLASVRASSG